VIKSAITAKGYLHYLNKLNKTTFLLFMHSERKGDLVWHQGVTLTSKDKIMDEHGQTGSDKEIDD